MTTSPPSPASAFASGTLVPTGKSTGKPPVPEMAKKEGLAMVGIPPHDKDPITENALRREWPTPQPGRDEY